MTDEWPAQIIVSLPAVVYRIQLPDGRITFLGESIRSLFGYDPRELIDRPTRHLEDIHPLDQEFVGECIREVLAGERKELQYRFRRADGQYRTVLHRLHVVRNELGERRECIGCCLDVTRVPQNRGGDTTRDVELTSAMRLVIHDLRAPLRAMYGFAEALQDQLAPRLGEMGLEFTSYIIESARQMDQLTLDLLTYARVGEPEQTSASVDLDRVLAATRERLGSLIRMRDARIETSESLPAVLGDRESLGHVFTQLLSNALTYVESDRRPQVIIRPERRGVFWRIWFEDNGIGIPLKSQKRIFGLLERLHGTATYPGTGLGLAIVRRAVQQLHGNYGVESTPGSGSRFWIDLLAATDRGQR